NASTTHRLVKLNVGTPTFQRAPGESTGTFALETAMDELAYALAIDPPELRSMRDGNWQIGWGLATATYPGHRSPATALARILPDGSALVQSGSQDLGTGTYTVMTQVAAETLGLPVQRVRFELGDTALPPAPVSGGSITVASVAPAVQAACQQLRSRLIALATEDPRSSLAGVRREDALLEDGSIVVRGNPARRETLAALATRHGDALA